MVLTALLVRLAFVYETRDAAFVRHPVGDAAGYIDWAERIGAGDWLGREGFYQAPLYPYLVAVLFAAFGQSVTVVRVAQAVMGAGAVWCLCFTAGRVFGRRTGLVAGWMLAVYGPGVFFEGVVQKTSLGGLLVCGLLAVIVGARRLGNVWGGCAVGVVGGLLVLTREHAIVWVPVVGLWLWCRSGREGVVARVLRLAGYGMGLGAVLVPVGVRNAVVAGAWSFSTFQAGPNFYIGNHRGANGGYVPLVRGHESPAFERRDATRLAEQEAGRELTAREVSDYWMARAVREIREDPIGWFRLLARKGAMVWNRYEISDVESPYVYSDYSVTLRLLGWVWHFGMLGPLAAVGVVSRWGGRRRLWVYYAMLGSMAAAVAMFYVLGRYRFPLVPLLILFAAGGAVDSWGCLRRRDVGRLMGRGVVAGLVAVGVNWRIQDEARLRALAWMNVGVALAEEGELAGATEYFQRAVQGDPQSAEANNNLGQALALQGDYAAAIPHYQAALAAAPTLVGVDYNLGVALERVGRVAEALSHYERALTLDRSDADARAAVARLRGP